MMHAICNRINYEAGNHNHLINITTQDSSGKVPDTAEYTYDLHITKVVDADEAVPEVATEKHFAYDDLFE